MAYFLPTGQVPETTLSEDAKAQTAEVLTLIDALLARAGTDKTKILMAQVGVAAAQDCLGS